MGAIFHNLAAKKPYWYYKHYLKLLMNINQKITKSSLSFELFDQRMVAFAKFVIVSQLFVLSYMLWGVNIVGADDPFTAIDSYRSGGVFDAALGQAQGQGRFYWAIAFVFAQTPYIISDTWYLSLIRISTNLLVILVFIKLLRSLWGRDFALFTTIIFLALFTAYKPHFNSFRDAPMDFALCWIVLLYSFYLYNESKKNDNLAPKLPFLLFFFSLLFYESILFYVPLYFVIYMARNSIVFKFSYLKSLLWDFRWLFFSVLIYLSLYFIFRFFYPSSYEGNQGLDYPGLSRAVQTISNFSFWGLNFKLVYYLKTPYFLTPFLLAFMFFVFVNISTLRICFIRIEPLSIRTLVIIPILIYSAVAPNILYGFVDKYHSWSDAIPYYIGTYYSTFSMAVLVSFVFVCVARFLFRFSFFKRNYVLLPFFISVCVFANYNQAFYFFEKQKLLASKWTLIDELASNHLDVFGSGTALCTETLFDKTDSFGIYDYWSYYFSRELGLKIEEGKVSPVKIKHSPKTDQACDWYLSYSGEMLTITELKGPMRDMLSISIP